MYWYVTIYEFYLRECNKGNIRGKGEDLFGSFVANFYLMTILLAVKTYLKQQDFSVADWKNRC